MFGALALKLVTPLRIQRAQEGFGVTIICDIAKHTNTDETEPRGDLLEAQVTKTELAGEN